MPVVNRVSPVGIEPIFAEDRPAGIGHDAGGAEMVFEQIVQGVAATADVDPHRT